MVAQVSGTMKLNLWKQNYYTQQDDKRIYGITIFVIWIEKRMMEVSICIKNWKQNIS